MSTAMNNRIEAVMRWAAVCVLAGGLGALAAETKVKKEKTTAKAAKQAPAYPVVGEIERLDPSLNKLIPTNAVIEKLAEGFLWAEGPVWMGDHLLFSDVPTNRMYKWQQDKGISVYLEPSGYTGSEPRGGEMGSNGLTRDSRGQLVVCQHGDRRVARLEKDGRWTILAQFYHFRRFNSPNDAVFDSRGDLYFTDPPYGLPAREADPRKELLHHGVYRVSRDHQVTLLTDKLTRPNGLAFSPDGRKLYVANSDPARPVIYAFEVLPDGNLGKSKVFFNASDLLKSGRKGLPDGLKVDRQGNLFATGPGGVLVLSPDGQHLGTILTGVPTANCAWGENGKTLYITAQQYLLRLRTSTTGRLP